MLNYLPTRIVARWMGEPDAPRVIPEIPYAIANLAAMEDEANGRRKGIDNFLHMIAFPHVSFLFGWRIKCNVRAICRDASMAEEMHHWHIIKVQRQRGSNRTVVDPERRIMAFGREFCASGFEVQQGGEESDWWSDS